MCGLVGVYNFAGHPLDLRVLQRMADIQHHRGPDDQGLHLFSLRRGESVPVDTSRDMPVENHGCEAGFGFNRLSILDLSPNGHQPMCSASGHIGIVLNGEIYNAFDYREGLEAQGYRFRSRSDTEVALYLYEQYGMEGMLERLNGMFALGIFDLKKKCLFLARDRLGIKPLYLYRNRDTLLFSSESKSFYESPDFEAALDSEGVDEQLMFRYVAGGRTLLKDVTQLAPGTYACVRPEGLTEHRYWDIPAQSSMSRISLDDQLDSLQAKLDTSVGRQLLSDVKVGCQLSGGIDSSLVSVIAAQRAGATMESFSITFDDPRYSEEPWIDEAAATADIQTHKYQFDESHYFDSLQKATWHLDQPLNHPNTLGLFLLAGEARKHITVCLSGEGADELFGGYTRFLYAKLRPGLTPWSKLLSLLPKVGARLAQRYHVTRHLSDADWFIVQSAFQSPEQLQAIRPQFDMESSIERRRHLFDKGEGSYVGKCTQYALRTYLVDLLIRQDKMTMAHSMENRVPFLDHELVEHVRGLPDSSLVSPRRRGGSLRMGSTKVILKRLAERYFDKSFVYRLKSGFPLPLRAYFSAPQFRPLMEEVLLPGMRGRGLVDADAVSRIYRSVERQSESAVESLWIATALELWAQTFLDGAAVRSSARGE
jgi:asparagine synthase (glutamine-hydrolysing)